MADSNLVVAEDKEDFFQPTDVPETFKKSVGVVQVAMGELGLLHRKCYNVALANAYEGLGKGKLTFRMPISLVAEWCDFNSNNYRALYDVFEELRKTQVRSITFDKKGLGKGKPKRSIGSDGLLAGFRIIEGGIVEYSFTENMAGILYEPEQYIWMSLATQNKFSSKYELNLFENCIRYVGIGTTGFKDVEDWRGLLGANEPVYNEFKNFNRKVIKEATKGVNDKSGILVEAEFEREKRRISRIKFSVRENPQMQLLDYREHSRIRKTLAYKNAVSLGLKDVEAIYWVESHGEAYLSDAVAYVQEKKPKKAAAYLVSALKQGFAEKSPEERKKEEEAQKRGLEFKAQREAQEKEEKSKAALKAKFRDHQNSRVQNLLKKLSPEDLAFVIETISSEIPIRAVAVEWEKLGRDPFRLSETTRSTRAIIGVKLAEIVLQKWGDKQDYSIEEFKKLLQEN